MGDGLRMNIKAEDLRHTEQADSHADADIMPQDKRDEARLSLVR